MDNTPSTPPVQPPQPAPAPAAPPPPPVTPPAPQPVGPDSGPFVASRPPKKSKKGWVIGGIIAGALVVLGGGSALAYNLWYQNPEKVIFDALTHAFKAESMTGEGVVKLKTDDMNLKVTFDTEGNGADGRANAKVAIDSQSTDDGISVDVNASLLVKGDTLYFKLDNVRKTVDQLAESFGEVPDYFDPIINKIDGQWVSVKASDYEDVSKEYADQQRCIADLSEKLSTNNDMKKELTDLYKQHRILIIDKKLPAKTINGVGSLGYEISADANAAQNFAKGLADTAAGKELKKCNDDIDFGDIADAIKEADEDNDATVKTTFELWVSRFGHQITEVNLAAKDDEASGSFVFHPRFNKDVTIEAPANAMTVKQLQADIEAAMEEYYSDLFSQEYSLEDYERDTSSYNLN